MENRDIVWARSLLAVYRQAAVDISREGVSPEAQRRLQEELNRLHARISEHEDLESLWHKGFQGSEAGIKAAFAPLVESAMNCSPDSPMRALAEFAAEEIAFVFDS